MTITIELSESTVRSKAKRRGYALQKWRGRDPRAIEYGTYGIIDPCRNCIVAHNHNGFGMSLEECNVWLDGK